MFARLAALALLIAVPAHAKDINLPLNEQEQAALRRLHALALQHSGDIEVARVVVYFDDKIKTYLLQADKPPPAPPANQ